MVLREVAACEIAEAIRLVVVAVVLLRRVADIGRFFVVESVVPATVVAPFRRTASRSLARAALR